MCLSPFKPSVTFSPTSFTSTTRVKVSPPSSKLLDLRSKNISWLVSQIFLVIPELLRASLTLALTNYMGSRSPFFCHCPYPHCFHQLFLFAICNNICMTENVELILDLRLHIIVLYTWIPIIGSIMFHCSCTVIILSFNDFFCFFTFKCSNKSVHFNHSTWVLFS